MQEQQITPEQQQANQKILEQLQRVPVMRKTIQLLERQTAEQRNEIAELTVIAENMQQQLTQYQQNANKPTEPEFEEVTEQDENSES